MGGEYVRFAEHEGLRGQKDLLITELGVLNIVKRLRMYQRLRSEEHAMRILFKRKMGEVLEILKMLDRTLPHSRMMANLKKEEEERKKEQKKMEEKAHVEKKGDVLTLEQEVEMIRRRLEKLNG